MKKGKRIVSGVLVGAMTASLIPSAMVPALAKELTNPTATFRLLNQGEVIKNPEQAKLEIYSDERRTEAVSGTPHINEDSVSFAANGVLDDTKDYYYVLHLPNFKDRIGQFRFVGNTIDLQLDPKEDEAQSGNEGENTPANPEPINTKPSITITSDQDTNGVLNKDLKLHLSSRMTGIIGVPPKKLSYTVKNGTTGEITQSGSFEGKLPNLSTEGDIIIEAAKNNSNHVTLTVTAVGVTGETSTQNEEYAFDTTSPKVLVLNNGVDLASNMGVGKSRTVKIEIRERNFDPDLVDISVLKSENGSRGSSYQKSAYSISDWSIGTEDSDENRSTATVTFSEEVEGYFYIDVSAKDKAGNEGTFNAHQAAFFETSDPVISEPTSDQDMSGVLNEDLKLRLTADNSLTEIKKLSYSVKNNTTGEITQEGSFDGGQGDLVIEAAKNNSNHVQLIISAEDMAGNTSSLMKEYAFDITKPEIEVSYDNTDAKNGSYYAAPREATIRIKERNFDPKKVTILTDGGVEVSEWTIGAADSDDNVSTAKVRFMKDGEYHFSVKAEDSAGNKGELGRTDTFFIDQTAPKILEPTSDQDTSGVLGADLKLHLSAEDVLAENYRSEIKKLSYTVKNNTTGEITQEGSFDGGQGDLVIEAAKNNSNHVQLIISAEDMAGNTSSLMKEYAFDITKPEIEVSYDNTDAKNGSYYAAPREATIRIKERNFDPKKVTILTDGGAEVSEWTIGAADSDDNVSTAKVRFMKDGEYHFSVKAEDSAGNKGELGREDHFILDQNAPVISMQFDGSFENGKYAKGKRTAIITVDEHNFNTGDFTASIKAQIEGQGIAAPELGAWTRQGDRYTTSLSFEKDGDYSFLLSALDLAGNRSNEVSSQDFTIDNTAPEIQISGVEDQHAYKDVVSPKIDLSDVNLNEASLSIKLRGQKHAETNVTGQVSKDGNRIHVSLADFAHVKESDDLYTMSVEVVDMAGNVTRKEVAFSVNRFGSTFSLDQATDHFVKGNYHKQGEDLVVFEQNVDAVPKASVILSVNGQSRNLQENEYDREEISSDGWKRYRYQIKKEALKEEGLYDIEILSEDAAGNTASTKVGDLPIGFAIDKTAPEAAITGIENNQIYDATEKETWIDVRDNYALDHVDLFIGNKVVKTFSKEELEAANGKISYVLKEADGWQEVSLKAYDAAGNEAESNHLKVLVSSSSWIRFINSLQAKVAIGASFIALLAGGFFLLLAKRRKKDEEEQKKEEKR